MRGRDCHLLLRLVLRFGETVPWPLRQQRAATFELPFPSRSRLRDVLRSFGLAEASDYACSHRDSRGILIGAQLVRPVSAQSWLARSWAMVLASQIPQ